MPALSFRGLWAEEQDAANDNTDSFNATVENGSRIFLALKRFAFIKILYKKQGVVFP